jgi:hypothetical protein
MRDKRGKGSVYIAEVSRDLEQNVDDETFDPDQLWHYAPKAEVFLYSGDQAS